MSVSVQIGLLFSIATAFASILGFLYKHRGAVGAPAVTWRHPLRSSIALFSNRWWTIGMAVAMGSWGLHVTALALAPITLVQTVIAGGLVLLTVVADRMFGFEVRRREWIGVALTAAGLAILAATLGGETTGSAHNDYGTGTLALYVGGLTVASGIAVLVGDRVTAHAGLWFALAAGLQWGGSDVTIKALSGALGDDGVGVLASPLAAVILTLSLIGLVVSARSLQVGDAIPVIAVTSAAANLSTIASGLVVFGEPLPDGTFDAALRLGAFGLVISAAAMTRAPLPIPEERAA
jgi:hypothetical protein